MAQIDLGSLLTGQDGAARAELAQKVGVLFSTQDLPSAERAAAEALAYHLAKDTIEEVRRELSLAVRDCKSLPRETALRIAHDIDSIACSFLEVTEVFSEEDWQQLVMTISRGARVAVARRTSMSEGLAVALAEIGDAVVGETLIENRFAPMSEIVCGSLINRFETSNWVLDKLAERGDLAAGVGIRLMDKVSAAARAKLVGRYKIPDAAADAIATEAEHAALLNSIRATETSRLLPLVQRIDRNGKLTDALLLKSLDDGSLAFFEVALSERARMRFEKVRSIIRRESNGAMSELLATAGFTADQIDDIKTKIEALRAA